MKSTSKSPEVVSLINPIREVIAEGKSKNPGLKIDLCCISAAGPVENNFCQLTNCKWAINGEEIGKAVNAETIIINDFMAIGYGIPTLDVDDTSQITRLPCTDGTFPKPEGDIKIAVGAGTGLGVGYLIARDGKYRAYPSEGGHSNFAEFDDETRELKQYVIKKKNLTATSVGTEPFVSGMGIYNAFNFLSDTEFIFNFFGMIPGNFRNMYQSFNRAKINEKTEIGYFCHFSGNRFPLFNIRFKFLQFLR